MVASLPTRVVSTSESQRQRFHTEGNSMPTLGRRLPKSWPRPRFVDRLSRFLRTGSGIDRARLMQTHCAFLHVHTYNLPSHPRI